MDTSSGNKKIVHIVSFNIPWPADYGGVIDVFYKIRALKESGVGVILHCFAYGRRPSLTLENECLKVHYYRRDLNLFHLTDKLPFIVVSRKSDLLLKNLLADNHPVIFEGLHSTGFINHPDLRHRIKIVRTHNVEHIYYRALAFSERNIFRKLYFRWEATKLERYEAVLASASAILAISPGDTAYFEKQYGKTLFAGPFHPGERCTAAAGKGSHILIHADFSTAENNSAALSLLRGAVSQWRHPTLVAGRRPSKELMKVASQLSHVTVIPNPRQQEMNELIAGAHISLLNASHPTGMKLKLINSLFSGRHVVASEEVVTGSGLRALCHIAVRDEDWVAHVTNLMSVEFTEEIKAERSRTLHDIADNRVNAGRITDWLVSAIQAAGEPA